jgi:hypothetical protein
VTVSVLPTRGVPWIIGAVWLTGGVGGGGGALTTVYETLSDADVLRAPILFTARTVKVFLPSVTVLIRDPFATVPVQLVAGAHA